MRNFCIISHIDHGKSTLADRFLELGSDIDKKKLKNQFLDSMTLEKEKGITIKMHPVRLNYKGQALNLIDTPGHIDFSYEISRALACCEGAVLLVDATKGIQAQTVFNLEHAKKQGLKVIGVVNKVDAASVSQVSSTKKELAAILKTDDILEISGKTGYNVEVLLEKVIKEIPSAEEKKGDFQGLIFDSKYDSFSGVIAFLRVFSGELKKGDKTFFVFQNQFSEAKEVGFFYPELRETNQLRSSEIGYIKTGIKDPSLVKVGDTITKGEKKGLKGYKEPESVLFLSLYPSHADDFALLKDALNKLKLNDPALNFQIESQMALGRGFRIGFLGSLHAEITIRRLKLESNLDLIATSPQVVFEIEKKNGKVLSLSSPALWPPSVEISETREPWVEIEIITPNHYFNNVFKLLKKFSCFLKETKTLTKEKSLLICEGPLREIISGSFYDNLKSLSQGYASFSFKQKEYRESDLVKVDILIAGNKEEALSRILPKEKAFLLSKELLLKLKNVLPQQQFSVSLQASVEGKIIARETKKAARKDVTAPLYGGDVTRKRKLLERQKKGKKELKEKGKVNIPSQVFLDILKT